MCVCVYVHMGGTEPLGHCSILILFFFNNSAVNVKIHLGSLSCCMAQFQPSFERWADILVQRFSNYTVMNCKISFAK